ncbi:hypothetical protein EP56_07560 [Listeriaceae bacterium FSL A5-0209]|nr:hypothetical protein EP56_07560 [Listeriaceae bacterium FSL A5-0209]
MATIKSPNEKYTGVIAGVGFANGIGKTDDPWLKTYFEEKGYQVIEEEVPDLNTEGTTDNHTPDLENQTNQGADEERQVVKDQLEALGIEYAKNAKTETLQKLLADNQKQEGE